MTMATTDLRYAGFNGHSTENMLARQRETRPHANAGFRIPCRELGIVSIQKTVFAAME
jgi:hypothetical protein